MQDAIDTLIELQLRRRNLMRARIRLTNHSGAIKRGLAGGANKPLPPEMEWIYALRAGPLLAATKPLVEEIKTIEKDMVKIARMLPCADWWCSHKGMSLLGIAQVIGESGNVGRFRNPSCLWKRFGLHVEDGKAPRATSGKVLDWSPKRRSVVFVVATSVIMAGEGASIYRALYDDRKPYEAMKAPDLKPAQINNRAIRYMAKRILRDLWCQWRNEIAAIGGAREAA